MTVCTKCGHEVAPEAKYCSNCGATAERSPTHPAAAMKARYAREDAGDRRKLGSIVIGALIFVPLHLLVAKPLMESAGWIHPAVYIETLTDATTWDLPANMITVAEIILCLFFGWSIMSAIQKRNE